MGIDGGEGLDEADRAEGTPAASWTAFDLVVLSLKSVREESQTWEGPTYQDIEGVQKLAPTDRVSVRGERLLTVLFTLLLQLQLQVRGEAGRDAASHRRRSIRVATRGKRHGDCKVILTVKDGQRLAADLPVDAGQGRLSEADDGTVVGVVRVGTEDEAVDIVANLGKET